ncbi:hypothetical protein U5922_002055 [Aquicoccus sp. G2-2]|uniref:hypothetical protein n=1 Tax=Aquicoccus sp. G2-2 TaxID=3092120 RepID=UPI002ADFDA58|nr:hypothetical protein [Aquicoccus sp. G2-2]MEA1112312.1 hypothetical protein [Aquicoccus sp. G2-2]
MTYPTILIIYLSYPATPTCISGKPEPNQLELEMHVEQKMGLGPPDGRAANASSLSELWEIMSSVAFPSFPDAEWLMDHLTREGRRQS